MRRYLIAVVMSAVLAIGLLVYGTTMVAAQFGPQVTCTTTCTPPVIMGGVTIAQGSCTTVCR